MYQICTPKVPRILNPTYHLTLSQTETYVLCVDLIIIIVKQFFPNLNLDPLGGSVAFFGPPSERFWGFFVPPNNILHTPSKYFMTAVPNGRSTIGRKLLLIVREARLPIILVGKNHCLINTVNVVNEHHAILRYYHSTYKQNVSYTDWSDFHLISRKS